MSVSNQTNKTYGLGDGLTTGFSFSFKIFDISELYIYKINTVTGVVTGPLTYTTHYTAIINAVTEGGTITFVTAPTTSEYWFAKRVVPFTQSAVIPSEGPLPGPQIENQLDLLTMMCVQMNEAISRTAQLKPTSLVNNVILPDPIDGNVLVWSGTSGLMINAPYSAAAITSSVAAAAASATAAAASATTAASNASAASASATAAAASATAAAVSAAAILAALPSGIIMGWKGTIATIPSGWVLCNGSNGTPDMRNVLPVGADADSGGVAKTSITGLALASGGSVTIGQTNLPSYNLVVTASNGNGDGLTRLQGTTNGSGDNNFNIPSGGGGTAYMPPFKAFVWIMKI